MIGSVAGSYKILDVVSVGGMGTVYRGEHQLIGRIAAVKVLHPEMSANKDVVQRFFNEAKATTSIKHPGIVEVYDFGYLESGHAYLVMEYLEGRTMHARNKQRGPIPEGEAAALLRGVCAALAAAHAKGIVHRDLKPDNIFLVPDADSMIGERPKLLDFGIAKLTDVGLAGSATKTGAVMGTPTYMSPEQCKGTGEVDHRADLYSLGCMFYEMVTGRPPFNSQGAGELLGAHLFLQPDPPSKYIAGLTPDTERLIMSLLAKNPAERPQTAHELAQQLGYVASRSGFASSTSWERPSAPVMDGRDSQPVVGPPTPGHFPNPLAPSQPHIPNQYNRASTPMPVAEAYAPVPTPSGLVTPMPGGPLTPSGYPGNYGQGGYTPMPGGYATPVPAVGQHAVDKPTTLSGAASQVGGPAKKSSRAVFAIAGVAILGGVIALAVAFGGGKGDTKAAAGGDSGAIAPTEPVAKPADSKPSDTKPMDSADTKPADTKPADTKPADTKSADTKPADTKPADTADATGTTQTATTGTTGTTQTAKTGTTGTTGTTQTAKSGTTGTTQTAKTGTTGTQTAKTGTTQTAKTEPVVKPVVKPVIKKKKTDPLLETDL